MSWTDAVDIYLFLVTGFGFWGALVLTRFFSLRWTNPTMKALAVLFTLIALGLGCLILDWLLSHLAGITLFGPSPSRLVVFCTLLTSGIWWVVWQVRVRTIL